VRRAGPRRCGRHAARLRPRREDRPSTFTQTVTAPDGAKKKSSSGSFEFARPNRFPLRLREAVRAADRRRRPQGLDLRRRPEPGQRRKLSNALGATPAALLAGGSLEIDFDLAAMPAKDGLDWVKATPKAKDGAFQAVLIGFRGKDLAAVEIVDSFGQRSLLQFAQLSANVAIAPERFVFTVPPGADVIEQ
jgi:outer membrane lipoprotein carrier protein